MRSVLVALSAIVTGLALVYWFAPEAFAPKSSLPIIKSLGGDFELVATTPAPSSAPSSAPSASPTSPTTAKLSDFYGDVILLNFGFTYCPDICPAVLGKMKILMEQLDPEARNITPVFVSFDAERDTPERLREYLGFFHPKIVGMVAEAEDLPQLRDQYKLLVEKEAASTPQTNYNFAHTDFIYLLDRQGRVRAVFSFSEPIDEIANKVKQLL